MKLWLLTMAPLVLFSFLISGCSPFTQSPPPTNQSLFLSPELQNYYSSGRVQMVNQSRKYSGELTFSLSSDLELNLKIAAPIIGSLLYEVRANPEKFMILDFQEQIYFLNENDSYSRQQWLGADISLEELSWVIWGRIPQTRFSNTQKRTLENNQLEFTSHDTQYLITLAPNGLLSKMIKRKEGSAVFEVDIQKYQTIDGELYPRKLQIFQTEGKEKLLLVMTETKPNVAKLPKVTFVSPDGMQEYTRELSN